MKRVLVASVLALSGAYGLSAQAQIPYQAPAPAPEVSEPYFKKAVPAPSQAFEINGTVSYTQPWGNITDTVSPQGQVFGRQIQDFAGAGLQFGLDLGYRASPTLLVGVFGTYAEYNNQTPLNGANFRSVTTGLEGAYHMMPYRSFDPWVTLGSAWRGNWYVPEVGGITSRMGWELARLQVGADFRLAREIAVAPYIAGDVNVIFSERLPGTDFRSLDSNAWYASFTAGVLGRFDVGGTYVRPGGAVAHR
jgi:opacity protein-like surface antigen